MKVFSGADAEQVRTFFAYDPAFLGGVFVAAGDVNGDGRADLITGAGMIGLGSGPHVKVFDGRDNAELQSFFAFDAAFVGGIGWPHSTAMAMAGTTFWSVLGRWVVRRFGCWMP